MIVTVTLLSAASVLLLLGSVSGDCNSPSLTTASGRSAPKGKICPGQLIFEDHFDILNKQTWSHETNLNGGYNGEFEWYTDASRNSFVHNGKLIIQPTLTTDVIPDLTKCNITITTPCTGKCSLVCSHTQMAPPIQSARLVSTEGFAFKYGRVEFRAKLPTGDWLWPALWFMPRRGAYGRWPLSGEIDLMESRGNRKAIVQGKDIGVGQFGSTLHFGTEKSNDAWSTAHFLRNAPGLNEDFHLYQLDWTPQKLTMSLDGVAIGTISTGNGFYKRGHFSGPNPWAKGGPNAPFDQEFYIILNVAVGATSGYFPESIKGKTWHDHKGYAMADFWNGRKQWLPTWDFNVDARYSSTMQVDYIKVFAL